MEIPLATDECGLFSDKLFQVVLLPALASDSAWRNRSHFAIPASRFF